MAFGTIKAVGLEVEGPFKDAPQGEFIKEFKAETMPPCRTDAAKEVRHYRECVSQILRYPKNVDDFFESFRAYWVPQAVVPGMGFHVHFSLMKPEHYDILFSKKFIANYFGALFDAFKDDKELMARPTYRSEMGTNFFNLEYPDEYFKHRIKKKPHDHDRQERYYGINFWRAYEDHGTFEIRIFPANTIEKMKEYVYWTIDFINKYVEENRGVDEVKIIVDCSIEKLDKSEEQLVIDEDEVISLR